MRPVLRILSVLTSAFPLWVLAVGILAVIRPTLFTWFSGPLITIGLGVIMLSMGMTLGFEDFRRVGRERGRVLPGVLLQYTVMPTLGWSLGYLFDLPTPFAAFGGPRRVSRADVGDKSLSIVQQHVDTPAWLPSPADAASPPDRSSTGACRRLAHASNWVPSTVKCSSESSC